MKAAKLVWYLPHPRNEGTLIYGAHTPEQCEKRRLDGEGCALHGPTKHWAVDLPLVFKAPKQDPYVPGGLFRECDHEVWHDDPDDVAFRKSIRTWLPTRTAKCPCRCCLLVGFPCEYDSLPF